MSTPAFPDVLHARQRIDGRLRRTPLVRSEWLSRLTGSDVRLKLETLQETHSFKTRGALNAVARLRTEGGGPVVTASAGNHGLAIAWAAAQVGASATVFTPRHAPRTKLDAIRSCGADLRPVADDYEHAERLALDWAQQTGARFVSPYNHPDVIAGAGTVALEIVEDWPGVDTIVVPVGGGGLISGIAIVARALRAGAIRVIGIEAEASAAFTAARRAGELVRIQVSPTIADGLGGNIEPGSITWPLIRDLVDEVTTVTEDELLQGIAALVAHERLVAEGAGIAAVAALAAGRVTPGRRVAVILSGANIDVERLEKAVKWANRGIGE